MKVLKKSACMCFLYFVVASVSAETLEERVEALEEKVQYLIDLTEGFKKQLSPQENSAESSTPVHVQTKQGPASVSVAQPAEESVGINRNSENVISATLVMLKYTESNAANDYANDYSDWLSFGFIFTSNLEKTTRAVKGSMIFTDLFGEEWWRIGLTLNDPLEPDTELVWAGTVDYNMYTAAHKKAKNTDTENVTITFDVSQVIYEDGDRESF